ncbi:MAG: pyridoxamine 5'-phosphate oxidase family protein [Bryobacterales bacterium]|nr:pyridoxamine 5'-phosphate oxidase family protein [Bryobacterales bacterium]
MCGKEQLREIYGSPLERARIKTLRKLDKHCRRFIELSPFLCLGTSGAEGADVTPRGDQPGFVHVLDEVTLAIPDWPGNNRLDSLLNIVENPQIGLLFLVPGVEESLRVNGAAHVTVEDGVLARWTTNGKHPRSALIVTVREAFLHCGKALIRSRLWRDDYKVERASLPSYGQMLKDQIEIADTAEEMEASVAHAYREKLY